MKVIDNLRKTSFMSTDSRILEVTDYQKGWIHIEVSNGEVINLSPKELTHIHNWVHNQEKPEQLIEKQTLETLLLRFKESKVNPDKYNPYVYAPILHYDKHNIMYVIEDKQWILTDMETSMVMHLQSLEEVIEYMT